VTIVPRPPYAASDVRPLRFVKCDVEGHEFDVFRRGKLVLREDRPDLLFEVEDLYVRDGTLFQYLEKRGYGGLFFLRGEMTPVSRYAELRARIPRSYLNYVFVSTDRFPARRALRWRLFGMQAGRFALVAEDPRTGGRNQPFKRFQSPSQGRRGSIRPHVAHPNQSDSTKSNTARRFLSRGTS